MEELWPPPSKAAAALIRALCERLVNDADALVSLISDASVAALADPGLLADASLQAESHEFTRSDLVQWLTSNIQHPGSRVEPYVGSRIAAHIEDLSSRGLNPDYAAGWRAALSIAWKFWVQECVLRCSEPELLTEVLDVSGQSMVQYALDSVSMLREASLTVAMNHADAEAIALIQLIASGAPISEQLAEQQLGYRMTCHHVALVLWVDEPEQSEALENAAAALRSSFPERQCLVARASTVSRWIWYSGSELPRIEEIEVALANVPGVRAAAGSPGNGIDGFSRSHQAALAAQAMLARVGSERRFTLYAHVELVDGLTRDRDSARRFVRNTLGPLAVADKSLQHALLTYIQCGFNTTRAAAQLYLHRNTVERRVSRANELSAIKVENNPAFVAAALLVVDLLPEFGVRFE